jgi:hypothetical protein
MAYHILFLNQQHNDFGFLVYKYDEAVNSTRQLIG